MKKATPFLILGLVAGFALAGFAVEQNSNGETFGDNRIQSNPVTLLPGMRCPSTPMVVASALPAQVISDVTNYPNPFDSRKSGIEGETIISYSLANDSHVSIGIYDLLGQLVRRWDFRAGADGGRAGNARVMWDGTNETGRKVSKGGYIAEIQVEAPQTTATVIRKIGVIH